MGCPNSADCRMALSCMARPSGEFLDFDLSCPVCGRKRTVTFYCTECERGRVYVLACPRCKVNVPLCGSGSGKKYGELVKEKGATCGATTYAG